MHTRLRIFIKSNNDKALRTLLNRTSLNFFKLNLNPYLHCVRESYQLPSNIHYNCTYFLRHFLGKKFNELKRERGGRRVYIEYLLSTQSQILLHRY